MEACNGNKDIIFYKLNGFLLSICDRKVLADFMGINADGKSRTVTIGYNVETKEEVLRLYDQIKNKGATILKEPAEPAFGGLFFYFEDVEGNILEIAFNSFITLDKDNNVIDHKAIDRL